MWGEIVAALGLVLVIEGLVPSISPASWRQAMRQLLSVDDARLRYGGLACMVIGALLLASAR